jgi:hypothetical protein
VLGTERRDGEHMSLFVWAVILGLVFHQTISVIQPLTSGPGRRWTRLTIGGRIMVLLPTRTYLNIRVALIAFAAIVLVLGAVLIMVQRLHPPGGYPYRVADVITSPRIAAAFFGAFVGILIGNLFNRAVGASRGVGLRSMDWLQIALIFLLLFLGIGGDELLHSYSGRISKISFGATNEIAFSDATIKPPIAPVERPSTAFKSALSGSSASEFLRGGGSAGLLKNAELADMIVRDRNYLSLLKEYDNASDMDAGPLGAAEKLVRTTISPFSSCLAAIYARTANARFVTEQLANVIDEFAKLIVLDHRFNAEETDGGTVNTFERAMADVAQKAYDVGLSTLLQHSGPFEPEDAEFIQACTAIMSLRCATFGPDPIPTDTPWLKQDVNKTWLIKDEEDGKGNDTTKKYDSSDLNAEKISIVESCMRQGQVGTQQGHVGEDPYNVFHLRKIIADTFEASLTDEVRGLPYLSIAYSSFLAQLGYYYDSPGYYSDSALVLHKWITQAKSRGLRDQWFMLRARFFLAGYLEEWIRSQGDAVPLSLRQYHIDNFEQIIEKMRTLKTIEHIEAISGKSTLNIDVFGATLEGDEGTCEAAAATTGTQEEKVLFSGLYQSYVSAIAGYIDHSLKHQDAASKQALKISNYTHQLMVSSLKCLDENAKVEKRAEILDFYGRNQLNLVDNTALFKSADTLRSELMDAERAIQLGIELIENRYTEALNKKNDKSQSFLFRISSSEIIDLHEKLIATKERLKIKESALPEGR